MNIKIQRVRERTPASLQLMLKLSRPLKWRHKDAGQKRGKKRTGKNGHGCRQGAGKATTGTGSSCTKGAGQRTAPKKPNHTKCPCKTDNQPRVSQEPVCLSVSSRELSSSSWGSHVTQRKMSGFLLKKFNDYITPFSTWPDRYKTQLSSCQLLWLSVRINCTSPKYPEDLWSY